MSRLSVEERDRLAEAAQREQANKRLQLEHTASVLENERAIIEHIRAGGQTGRQRVALELLAELNTLGRGRWVTSTAQGPVWGSPASKASEAIATAVRAAAAEALRPFLEQAEAELKAADEERDRILETGKL